MQDAQYKPKEILKVAGVRNHTDMFGWAYLVNWEKDGRADEDESDTDVAAKVGSTDSNFCISQQRSCSWLRLQSFTLARLFASNSFHCESPWCYMTLIYRKQSM